MDATTATVKRLEQIAADAEAKSVDADTSEQRDYYAGMRDGLLRAVRVVEGRG